MQKEVLREIMNIPVLMWQWLIPRRKEPPEQIQQRRASHNIIEQNRRKRINDKISELKGLLGAPYEHQNKAEVLAGTIDNIKSLRNLCSLLLLHHRLLQQEYHKLLQEHNKTVQQFQHNCIQFGQGEEASALNLNKEDINSLAQSIGKIDDILMTDSLGLLSSAEDQPAQYALSGFTSSSSNRTRTSKEPPGVTILEENGANVYSPNLLSPHNNSNGANTDN